MFAKTSKAVENEFRRRISKLFSKLIADAKANPDTPISQLCDGFEIDNMMGAYIDRAITQMVTTQRVKSARSWRQAARKSSRGAEIYEALRKEMQGTVGRTVRKIVREDAEMIRSLSHKWAVYASRHAAKMTQEGRRPEEVEAELRKKLPEHMRANIKCIARTECAKANAALTEARCEDLDINAYIWRCVKDERSRVSHIRMDGAVCFWNEPPAPEDDGNHYHPGGIYNCRCFAEPIVDAEDLPNRMKVWINGRLQVAGKHKVMQMSMGRRTRL